jgi:uncharacterized protein (DUF1800 family)
MLLLAAWTADRPGASPRLRAEDEARVIHVLNRLAFGPRPGDVERVARQGLDAWVDTQLRPEGLPDQALGARLSGFRTLTLPPSEIVREYLQPLLDERRARRREGSTEADSRDEGSGRAEPEPAAQRTIRQALVRQKALVDELVAQKLLRAVYSERQLSEVLVDFWFNHFNVFANKGFTRIYLTAYERDAIRPHVFGRFRDLLGATAKSPAMLFYLDNARSADPAFAARAKDGMDRLERAGRRGGMQGRNISPETMALARQNIPAGINENYARELLELHTLGVDGGYTQQDIVAVARAFTGWTIGRPQSPQAGQFWFNPRMHDTDSKAVLGQSIRGGGIDDGERVLDLLARHPSTARHIATKLARRLVADDPPMALVERAAARFRATDGDLREVVRVIVTSPEFFAPAVHRAKVKTPFEFVVSSLRALDADVTATQPLGRALQQMGMPLYLCQPPTGYADTADAWVNTGALVSRMNFAVDLAQRRTRGVTPGAVLSRAGDDAHQAIAQLLGGVASEATEATIAKASTPAQVVALALGSPEFQKR